MALSHVVSEISNVEKCCDLEIRVKGHSRSLKVVPLDRLCMVFLLVFFSNFVHKMHRFWHIQLGSIQWPWNPGLGSLKVIENDTIHSGIHDFLLTFNSNHRPISYRFRDTRKFPSKITNFSHPRVFIVPLKGLPLELRIVMGSEETRMMGLPEATDGRKGFKIGLTV